MELSEGLVGSLIGAGSAIVVQLVSQWHARKLQREQWHQEQTYKNLEALRDAYVEWLDAMKKAGEEAARTHAIVALDVTHAWPEHDQAFAATKLMLLEPEVEAQARVRSTVATFYDAMMIIRDATRSDADRTRAYQLISTTFDETTTWLSSRFSRIPLDTLKKITKSGIPSIPRSQLEPPLRARREHKGT